MITKLCEDALKQKPNEAENWMWLVTLGWDKIVPYTLKCKDWSNAQHTKFKKLFGQAAISWECMKCQHVSVEKSESGFIECTGKLAKLLLVIACM
jgi:hypothetical protein